MKKENLIKKQAEEFFDKLGIKVEISVEQGEKETYNLHVETEDTGLLIGHHGETLTSLQHILNLMIAQKNGEWLKVIVHVGDYREKRNSYLENMANQVAERVVQTNKEEMLPSMSSFERRIIHLALSNHPHVTTESTGEAGERRIVVKPK